ncbi:MAG: putative metallopeptidase [Planctomycetota bacterium]
MGKTYAKAPLELRERCGRVMTKYHGELCDHEVKVDLVMAFAATDADGDPKGPAITSSSGAAAAACIRVVGLKDRVLGRGDAEMTIDGDRYSKWQMSTIDALLDHELTHLELTGNVDDLGRPKLRLRPHDCDFGWFDCVARRHGDHSFEVTQAKSIFGTRALRQLYLPGWEDRVPINSADALVPSITRAKAAAHFREAFDIECTAKSLLYVPVPVRTLEGVEVLEAWVDEFERAVIFQHGEVFDTTETFSLSAHWRQNDT